MGPYSAEKDELNADTVVNNKEFFKASLISSSH